MKHAVLCISPPDSICHIRMDVEDSIFEHAIFEHFLLAPNAT